MKEELGINEWLELIKEDRNLNGAYISISQYIYLVEKENQELKKHLKVPKACNLKTLEDYKSYYEDTTREQILEDTYIEHCVYVNLAHRYSELKKQVEELNRFKFSCKKDKTQIPATIYNKKTIEDISKTKSQQKKFIKYLEDEIQKKKKKSPTLAAFMRNVVPLQQCLQKYKEIIGTTNE